LATAWALGQAAFATFSQAFNNQAAAVHAGDDGALGDNPLASFSYAIVPAVAISFPLGVAAWDYDVIGSSVAAAGVQASVVLAATPGKAYRAAMLAASIAQAGAVAGTSDVQLLDGAAVIWTQTSGSGRRSGRVRPRIRLG